MTRSASPVVKLKPQTHAALQEIAREDDRSMGEIVGELVERYQRERFWRGAQDDLARLKSDPTSWASYQSESAAWDATVNDGLKHEPPYPDDTLEEGT